MDGVINWIIAYSLKNGIVTEDNLPWFRYGIEKRLTTIVVMIPFFIMYDPSLALLVVDNVRTGWYARKTMPGSVETLLRQLCLQDWYISLLKEVRFLCRKGHSMQSNKE